MRGDTVYRIYARHTGHATDMSFGTFRTRAEAQRKLDELSAKDAGAWVRRYHDRGLVIRDVVVDSDFVVPSRPMPRERYCIATTPRSNGAGVMNSTQVEVFERGDGVTMRRVAGFERNLPGAPFEPFRQGSRHFALVSRDYTRTAVLDLDTGEIIAEEKETPHGGGFCPVGFYVPDWWDVHDASTFPGIDAWDAGCEWPDGRFGFVWGCVWGDDRSWKIQYLDLGRVAERAITRDARFGYVELASDGYSSPALSTQPPPGGPSSPRFIEVGHDGRKPSVHFHVEMAFDLESGASAAWRRIGDPYDA